MFYLGQVDSRPSGYYAIPVDKSTYSLQPMANLNRMIEPRAQIIVPPNANKTRLITVNGAGELKMPPDQVRFIVVITSLKPNVGEAKASVKRRSDYVYQMLRRHGLNESEIFITTSNNRKDNNYEVVTEISTSFRDFKAYQTIYNILVEKLDKTVRVQPPEFYHTPARIDALKRQTTIQAIRNAKRIGFDLANSVGLNLGKPIEINQESFKEFYGDQDVTAGSANTHILSDSNSVHTKSMTDAINEKTLTMIATIKAVFELKPKK